MALMAPEDRLRMTMGTEPPQLGAVQHPMHAMIAPLEPAPPELDPAVAMGMSPDAPPAMPEGKQPKVKQMSATDQYKDKLEQKQMSDLQKDENPYGSENNHPGFFGKFLHGLSVATGGPNRRQFAEAQRNNQIQGIEKQEGEQAQQQAATDQAQARTAQIEQQTEAGTPVEITPEQATELEAPELAGTKVAPAVLAQLYKQRGINTTKQQTNAETVQGRRDVAGTNKEAKTEVADINAANKVQPHVTTMGPDGKPHIMERDPATGQYSIDRGIAQPNYAMVAPNLRTFNTKDEDTGENVVKTLSGRTLGPMADTNTTRSMGEMASTVQPMADNIVTEVEQLSNAIGPAVGRWNELLVNQGGKDFPEFAGLNTDLDLLASAIVRTHFGAKGGQQYREELKKMFSGAQSPQDLIYRIQHADSWIRGYASAGGHPLPNVASPANPHGGGGVIVQHSPSTNQYRYSTDGGKTWQAGQPPKHNP